MRQFLSLLSIVKDDLFTLWFFKFPRTIYIYRKGVAKTISYTYDRQRNYRRQEDVNLEGGGDGIKNPTPPKVNFLCNFCTGDIDIAFSSSLPSFDEEKKDGKIMPFAFLWNRKFTSILLNLCKPEVSKGKIFKIEAVSNGLVSYSIERDYPENWHVQNSSKDRNQRAIRSSGKETLFKFSLSSATRAIFKPAIINIESEDSLRDILESDYIYEFFSLTEKINRSRNKGREEEEEEEGGSRPPCIHYPLNHPVTFNINQICLASDDIFKRFLSRRGGEQIDFLSRRGNLNTNHSSSCCNYELHYFSSDSKSAFKVFKGRKTTGERQRGDTFASSRVCAINQGVAKGAATIESHFPFFLLNGGGVDNSAMITLDLENERAHFSTQVCNMGVISTTCPLNIAHVQKIKNPKLAAVTSIHLSLSGTIMTELESLLKNLKVTHCANDNVRFDMLSSGDLTTWKIIIAIFPQENIRNSIVFENISAFCEPKCR